METNLCHKEQVLCLREFIFIDPKRTKLEIAVGHSSYLLFIITSKV